jgi:membrane-bound ClpP family serine protease
MMLSFFKDKLFIALLLLLAITVLSWQIFFSAKFEPKAIGALLLILAFVKVQIIISQYMELNHAIVPIRIAFWIWTIMVAAISLVMYWR